MADKDYFEHQCSPSAWSHRLSAEEVSPAHYRIINEKSARTRSRLNGKLDQSYGDSESQAVDFFGADILPADAPVFVFLHGGYWQAGSRQQYSYVAEALVNAGILVAVMGYDIAPKVCMADIITQAKTGVHYITDWAERRGSSGVFLSGHSAGAQLVVMVLADFLNITDSSEYRLVKGVFLLSGVYDVRPFYHTSMNEVVKLTEREAWDYSPMKNIEAIQKAVVGRHAYCVVGVHESDLFHKQSKELQKLLENTAESSVYVELPDVDHFNIVEKLDEPNYALTQMICKEINKIYCKQ